MIYYINSVDKDINLLREHTGSKTIVNLLIKLQEYSRDEWAKIHSIVKTLKSSTPEENFKKSQEIIDSCLVMNLKLNKFYDKLIDICVDKKEKGNPYFLNYVLEEMYFKYSIFLDAIHFMGIYYIPPQTFPFLLCDVFVNRKMEELAEINEEDGEDEEAP
jgi:hypothetical protein